MAAKCRRCGHPPSWHRIDDSKPQPGGPEQWQFRCIGYDCDGPGFRHGTPDSRCGCPDFVPMADREKGDGR